MEERVPHPHAEEDEFLIDSNSRRQQTDPPLDPNQMQPMHPTPEFDPNQLQHIQHNGQVIRGINVTGGIEALVSQAVESSLERLDKMFDARLENKIESIAQRILTANSSNVATATGSHSVPCPNAVLGTAGQTTRPQFYGFKSGKCWPSR